MALETRTIELLADETTKEINLSALGVNSSDQLEMIVTILAKRKTPLDFLDLSSNNITDKLSCSLHGIRVNKLNLSANELKEGAVELVKNSPLIQSLDLTYNEIETEGAKQLMVCRGNTRISLDNNPIAADVLKEFKASGNYSTGATRAPQWLASPHTSSSSRPKTCPDSVELAHKKLHDRTKVSPPGRKP